MRSSATGADRLNGIDQSVGSCLCLDPAHPFVFTGFRLERFIPDRTFGDLYFHPGNHPFSISPGVKFETAKVAFEFA